MNQRELAERRAFDLRVLSDMRCATFEFEAYRTMPDLERRQRIITDPTGGAAVSKYRWIFRIPTHISRTQLATQTEIGVNTDAADYPHQPPGTWILSPHVPWSPHFLRGAPVCIGDELWAPTGGHITLGDLVIHIAHLLNWDEKGRGRGYVGWSGEAIAYHQTVYHGRPINPGLIYPMLPTWLAGEKTPVPVFKILMTDQSPVPSFRIHP
jgi:hypothetical protein